MRKSWRLSDRVVKQTRAFIRKDQDDLMSTGFAEEIGTLRIKERIQEWQRSLYIVAKLSWLTINYWDLYAGTDSSLAKLSCTNSFLSQQSELCSSAQLILTSQSTINVRCSLLGCSLNLEAIY